MRRGTTSLWRSQDCSRGQRQRQTPRASPSCLPTVLLCVCTVLSIARETDEQDTLPAPEGLTSVILSAEKHLKASPESGLISCDSCPQASDSQGSKVQHSRGYQLLRGLRRSSEGTARPTSPKQVLTCSLTPLWTPPLLPASSSEHLGEHGSLGHCRPGCDTG